MTIFDFLANKRTLQILRIKGSIIANYEAQCLAHMYVKNKVPSIM